MIKVAPSILSADFSCLGKELKSVATADYIHFDVMDGLFVPNISFGMPVLKCVRGLTDLPLDVHLMIERPSRYVEEFAKLGSDIITVHLEADTEDEIKRALELIRAAGKRRGISIKPGTDPAALEPFIESVELVLVMTVEPGFGGQGFMEDMLDKVRAVRRMIDAAGRGCELEVDGGINQETGALCVEAGADVLVAGSYIFNCQSREKPISELRGGGK